MVKRKYGSSDKSTKKKKTEETADLEHETEEQPQNGDDSVDEAEPAKCSFDVKHFRKEIARKHAQTIVLTQFLQVCLDPDSDADYLLQYLKVGGNSHEILRQVSTENKKNLTLATPAFHLFHLIILKVQSSCPHMIAITEEACRYFLNNFMSTVEIMISENSGPRHRKVILKLLTSMVTLNPDLGIEVLNQAPLTPKHLQYILEKPNYKEKDNVRTAFVHFMTSFLVDGHLPLIKALLEKQGLLSLVIPGLIQDEADAVLMFLNILEKNVIENSLISKSLKLKTFSHNVLHQMFKVFFWKGPPESHIEATSDLREEVISLLRDILLTLFTSHKLGLYFTDTTLGITDANKNQNLYKALLTLKRPWENQAQCDIVLEIIWRCPDLHRAVITLIEQSFEPQHTPIWERTVEFVMKLYDKLKPEELFQRFTKLNPLQVANFIRFTTLPIPLLKFIQVSIGKLDQTVSLYCVKVLVKMLTSLKKYLSLLEMDTSAANLKELKNKLEFILPRHFPAPNTIVTLIQNVLKMSEPIPGSQDYRLTKVNNSEALITLCDLLLLYSEIHPAHFESLEGNLNIKDILDFTKSQTEGNLALLKFKVVSVWLALDKAAVSLDNPMFRELFLIMLDVYTNDDKSIWIEAKDTLIKFFKSTGIFETDDEIHVMLYSLRNSELSISTICDIIEYVLKNIQELIEHVRSQTVDLDVGHKQIDIDLNKLLDDLCEGKNINANTFSDTKMPSPFIAGCVKYTQSNKEAKKSLKQFLSVYIINLLHSNCSPELTQVLIQDVKIDAKSYVTGWVSESCLLEPDTAGKDSILVRLSQHVLNHENFTLNELSSVIKVTEEEECDFQYMDGKYTYDTNTPADIDDTQLLIWAKYLVFCMSRLAELNSLQEEQYKKVAGLLDVILDLCKREHKLNVSRTILLSLLKNPYFIKIYSPVNSDNVSCKIVTEYVIDIIVKHKKEIEYLNKKHFILKAYRQNNYSDISKVLSKIKKKKNIPCENVVKVLNVIGMSRASDAQILNDIVGTETQFCVKDDKEPSIVLEVLSALISKCSKITDYNITNEQFARILDLYTNLLTDKSIVANLTDIETSLTEYFESKSQQKQIKVNEDVFRKFFNANTVRKSTATLAAMLLNLNVNFCKVFAEEVKRPEILSLRELTLPLGDALINHKQFIVENKELLNAIYVEYKTNIFKVLEKPHKSGQVYTTCWRFVRKLLLECAELSDCEKLFNKTHKFEVVEASHFNMLQTVFLKVFINPETSKKDYVSNYFLSVLNCLIFGLKEAKDPKVLDEIVTGVMTVSQICQSNCSEKSVYQKVIESPVWQNFCKAVLKDALKSKPDTDGLGPKLLSLLTALIKLFYSNDHEDIVTLFDMATSHSEFLKTLLSHSNVENKTRLLNFIYTLITLNKSVMKQQQIPVYLSAYGATRSPCDRVILAILHYYETNDLPVQEYKPYLWGDSAANYYAVRKNRTSSLWSQPTPSQIINLFDKETVIRTLENFPVTEKLTYHYELADLGTHDGSPKSLLEHLCKDGVFNGEGKTKDVETEIAQAVLRAKYDGEVRKIGDLTLVSHRAADPSIYDPAFVLPLLSHMLAPGSVASCFKLLRKGLLSVPVMALSSHCPLMRAAGYHVIHRFAMLLETETKHKNDKLLLVDFIDTLRRSLTSAITSVEDNISNMKNPRLPAVDALYLAKAIMVATAPFEPVFKPVNNFFIAKQYVDLTVVPDFLTLFHDSDVESTERRNWILDIITNGVKTMTDLTVVFKTMCVKMIMDFYLSVLCEKKCREKILGVIGAIVSVPRSCEIMIEGYSLMAWLDAVVKKLGKDDRVLFNGVVKIIKDILQSMKLGQLSKIVGSANKHLKSVVDFPEFRGSRDLEHDILVFLSDMSVLSDYVELDDYMQLLKTLSLLSRKCLKTNQSDVSSLVNKCKSFGVDADSLVALSKAIVCKGDSLGDSILPLVGEQNV